MFILRCFQSMSIVPFICFFAYISTTTSLRGPAPLHHTLLAGRTRTGVTLQTLHKKHFDHGIILKQRGFDIPSPESCTVRELLDLVSVMGARLLVDGIRSGVFIDPVPSPLQESDKTSNNNMIIYAPKISSEDRHIDWTSWSWPEINRR